MILFEKDWERYPSAIPHYSTKNTTWLDKVVLLDKMGIKNCLWPLALHNPQLEHVNPHSPDLTKKEKKMIRIECAVNPWYVFREIARMPAKAGGKTIDLVVRANRGNLALWWSFFNSIDFVLIQPRQTGKSVSVFQLIDSVMKFYSSNSEIPMITKDTALRIKAIKDLKSTRDAYPAWLNPISPDDPDNSVEFAYRTPHVATSFKTAIAKKDVAGADNLGRGITSQWVYIDEVPYCYLIDITLPVALSSTSAARDEAMAAGQPGANIFTTTAGRLDTRGGKYFRNFMSEGTQWTENFYDAVDNDDLKRMVERNASDSGTCRLVGVFSHRQLGYTDEWLFRKLKASSSKGESAEKDYLNQWVNGTSSSPLSPEQLDNLKRSTTDVVYTERTPFDVMIRWYLDKEELQQCVDTNDPFILGLDTSDATGKDSIGGAIVRASNGEVVGTFNLNESNLAVFTTGFLLPLLVNYPNITIIPEHNRAQMIIDTLVWLLPEKGINPFRRMYNDVIQNPERNELFKSLSKEIKRYGDSPPPSALISKCRGYFGFKTTGSSREVLYKDILLVAVKQSMHAIKDEELSSQIRQLQTRNGRVDHGSDGHDDLCISWLFCNWLIFRGVDLTFYNKNMTGLISEIKDKNRPKTLDETILDDMESIYRERLRYLKDKLKNSKLNNVEIFKLEKEIQVTAELLNESDDGVYDTMQQVMGDIRDERLEVNAIENRSVLAKQILSVFD